MAWLDLLSGTLLLLAILQGFKNGFIKAIISTFSLFIGVVLAFQCSGYIAGLLKEHTHIISYWVPFIAFLTVLVLAMLALRWLISLLQKTASFLLMGWVDKLLGIVLYVFIYFTIVSAVLYFLILLGVIETSKMSDAVSYPYLKKWWPYLMEKIGGLLPFIKTSLANFSV